MFIFANGQWKYIPDIPGEIILLINNYFKYLFIVFGV